LNIWLHTKDVAKVLIREEPWSVDAEKVANTLKPSEEYTAESNVGTGGATR
jgi:hypothetical protein